MVSDISGMEQDASLPVTAQEVFYIFSLLASCGSLENAAKVVSMLIEVKGDETMEREFRRTEEAVERLIHNHPAEDEES